MSANDYKPVSWNGEPMSTLKLNQMSSNTQYLFERMPRIRYSVEGIVRDTAVKVISGKTAYPLDTTKNYTYLPVLFGSYFTAGCRPVVTASVEAGNHRAKVVLIGTGGQGVEIDHTGFTAIVSHEEHLLGGQVRIIQGWVHWTATGY